MKIILTILSFLIALPLLAKEEPEPEPPAEKKEEAPKPKTHKVTKDTFKVEFEVDGIFMDAGASEISIETKSWAILTVLEALPQGASVKKGQSLVKLDFEKIDEKIRDLRFEMELTTLDLKVAEADLQLLEITSPMELAALERKNKQVQEDLKRYKETKSPHQKEAAEVTFKGALNSLSYAEEELKQLRKMYEADDLTEETEEIILKRAERAVERAKFSLKGAKIKKEDSLSFSIPRESHNLEEDAKRSELTLKTSRKTLPVALFKKRIEVQKLKLQLGKAKEQLARLEADHAKMEVPAPISGTLFRGTIDKGKWSGSAGIDPRLRRGGALKPNEVFMTIVPNGPLTLHATVPEKHLLHMAKGLKAEVRPTIDPDNPLDAVIHEISSTPVAPGSHGLKLNVKLGKGSHIRSGMTCKLKFVPYLKKDAVWVPKSSTFPSDESGTTFVYLHRKDRKPKKLKIQTGKRSGDKIEVLGGLRPGTEILLEKPGK